MAEPTTAAADTTAGFIVIGLLTMPHPDLIIAGLVGGIAAILSLEAMTVWERISSVAVAIMVSSMLGPIVVRAAPRVWPEILADGDLGALRLLVGFVLGVLAYRVLLPAIIRRAERKIGGKHDR